MAASVLDALGPLAVTSAVRDHAGAIVDFRYELVNPAFCEAVREPAEVLVGAGLLELFPAHRDLGLFDEYVRVVETGEPYEAELPWYEERDIKAFFEVRVVAHGDGYLMTGRDITEERRGRRQNQAYDAALDAITGVDLDGNITLWSSGAERLYGWRADEIIGRPVTTIFPVDAMDDDQRAVKRLLAGEPVEPFETVRLHRDGRRLDVELTVAPVTAPDGSIVGGTSIHREIGRRLAERRAREEQGGRLRVVLDNVPDALVVVRAVRDGNGVVVDFRRTYVNPVAAARIGTTPEELVGQSLWSVLPGVSSVPVFERFAAVLDTGVPDTFTLGVEQGAGRGSYVVRACRLDADELLLLVTDLADLPGHAVPDHRWPALVDPRAGRPPRSGLDELEAVLGLLPVPAWVVADPPNGRIEFANHAVGDMFREPAAALVGRRSYELLDPDELPYMSRRLEQLLATGSWAGPLRMRRRDGTTVSASLSVGHVVVSGREVFVVLLQDTSVEQAVTRALSESEERFRLTFEFAPVGMALVEPGGGFIDVNRALCAFFDLPRDQLMARTWPELTHRDDLELDRPLAEAMVAGDRDHYELEKRFIRSDGATLWGRLSVSIARSPEGRPLHFVSQILDVTESRNAFARLRADAVTDPLTGLANRRTLEDWSAVAATAAAAAAVGGHRAALYGDLDGFKAVNDRYGHHVGDELLRQVAERLEEVVRPEDHLARVGGDEFVLLCLVREPDVALSVGRRMQAAVREPFDLSVGRIEVDLSVGIAVGDAGTPVEHLIRDADAAMYRAKSTPERLLWPED
jgi:diguanylate cyclase (GGDEF)-like protein/PAS domain S-box-containing protein